MILNKKYRYCDITSLNFIRGFSKRDINSFKELCIGKVDNYEGLSFFYKNYYIFINRDNKNWTSINSKKLSIHSDIFGISFNFSNHKHSIYFKKYR